eukprot:1160276-Pelagomonas_calceolata.AAC.18
MNGVAADPAQHVQDIPAHDALQHRGQKSADDAATLSHLIAGPLHTNPAAEAILSIVPSLANTCALSHRSSPARPALALQSLLSSMPKKTTGLKGAGSPAPFCYCLLIICAFLIDSWVGVEGLKGAGNLAPFCSCLLVIYAFWDDSIERNKSSSMEPVREKYPEIQYEEVIVDNCCMQLVSGAGLTSSLCRK